MFLPPRGSKRVQINGGLLNRHLIFHGRLVRSFIQSDMKKILRTQTIYRTRNPIEAYFFESEPAFETGKFNQDYLIYESLDVLAKMHI
jgi:hypothetical protein